MAKKIHHFDGFTVSTDAVQIEVDAEELTRKFNKAQFALDSAIMTSMIPFMPQQTGQFINETQAESAALAGSGQVVAAAAPMGRFLYEGKTMVDVKTGSPWARKGAKKVLNAAAMTYVASAATAVLQLLRIILLTGGRRRND